MSLFPQSTMPSFPGVRTASGGHPPSAGPLAPRFGNAATTAARMAELPTSRFVKNFDYKQFGSMMVKQVMVIYGACILSRVGAAIDRMKESGRDSWNEVREHATRDSLGYFSWIFATPMVLSLYLAKMVPEKIRSGLVLPKPFQGDASSPLGKVKKLLHDINPMSKWFIPSNEQVKDQMHQAMRVLKETFPDDPAIYQAVEARYKDRLKHVNLARGLGWAMTAALLGVGINLYNVYITRKNVERELAHASRQQTGNTVIA